MTVKKEQAEIFNYEAAIVSKAIQDALDGRGKSYKYVETVMLNEEHYKTTIKPSLWPLVMSTDFEVQILNENQLVKVVARTTSQPMVFGDIAGFYNGYIQDFLTRLRNTLHCK